MMLARTAVTAAFIALATLGAVAPAGASPVALDDPTPGLPTGPTDPLCAGMPGYAACQGGPYAQPAQPAAPALPTSPFDPTCATMPADAACAGGPYSIPAPAPEMPATPAPEPVMPAPEPVIPAIPAPEPVMPAPAPVMPEPVMPEPAPVMPAPAMPAPAMPGQI